MPLPTVTLIGNVVIEPQITITDKGTSRLTLRVACNERRKDEAGNWIDGNTTFINATLWGYAAEAAGETVSKGTPVVIIGRLKSRTVEKDGSKTEYFDVHVDSLAVDVKKSAKPELSDPWQKTSPF